MTEVLDTVPEDFADAYGGLLLELARRISRAEVPKEIPQEVLGEKVDEWKPADCRHLSISHPSRYPTFEEIWRAARAPGETHPNLWALVPMPADQPLTARKTVNLYVLPPENLLGRGKA